MREYIDKMEVISGIVKKINEMKAHTKEGAVKAQWKEAGQIGAQPTFYCSNCKTKYITTKEETIIPMVNAFSFCPCCGADMREEEEGEEQ